MHDIDSAHEEGYDGWYGEDDDAADETGISEEDGKGKKSSSKHVVVECEDSWKWGHFLFLLFHGSF